MRLWLAAVAVTALALAGCGQYRGGGTPVASPPASALVPWQGFPADQKPRPIVWLQNFSPGFATNEGKLAAYCNKFVLGGGLPKNLPPLAVATWTDGTTASYRGISAADALKAMAAPKVEPDPQCASIPPLVINGASLGLFEFSTDRGKAQMTSWLFTATGVNGEVAYPAIVPSAFWSGGMLASSGNGEAGLSADGRSLTYKFAGAPDNPGPCGADYKGVVAESATAVAVALQMISHASPGSLIACPAIAQERSITVTLAKPLGGRVVADENGYAVAVCPVGSARGC
jgi:hypothetical protein